MIRVEELKKSFAGELLFDKVSFQLNPGERYSLVGRNGSGKSTLLKILTGQETSDSGEVLSPKHYRIGYLQQHIQFTQPTVLEEASLALPIEERDMTYKVEAILSGLGFKTEDFEKPPENFSGGYQLRIQLTKTLVQEPDCLLLDEPTNYLDIVSIRWLERFLRSWRGEMVLISHDRSFLDAVATHTMGLHRKQLFQVKGQTEQFFDQVMQMEEVHERTRAKTEKQRDHAKKFIERFGTKATKAKQAQSRKKQIERLPSLEKLAQIEGLDFRFRMSRFPGKRLLQADNISFRYPNTEDFLLQDISLEIEPGDRIAVIGKNGRGKSTWLRLLAGELQPSEGSIQRSENLRTGFFGQTNVAKLNPALSIEEEIAMTNPELPFSDVRGICGMMMFSQQKAEKKIGVLSGGEKSRVLLAKILASPCNLLLLDEPSNHLDIESVEALMEAVEEFKGSVVIVSHSEELLRRLPNKFLICRENHQQLFLGDYDSFLEKIGWEDQVEVKRKKNRGKKQDKRTRAEKIQERSHLLTPIKKQIKKLETQIKKLEADDSRLHVELETAAEEQDNAKIASTSREMGEQKKALEGLYQELEKLYSRYEEAND